MPENGKPSAAGAGLCIIEPGLDSYVGHRFNYNSSLCRAAGEAGIRTRVLAASGVDAGLAAKLPAEPFFSPAPSPSRLPRQLAFFIDPFRTNRALLADLKRLGPEQLGPGWTVFVGNADDRNMTALALWLRGFPPGKAPGLTLFVRFSYFRGGRRIRQSVFLYPAFRLLERLASGYRVRLVTDSDRLAEEYKAFTSLPVSVLPIPHTAVRPSPSAAGTLDVLSPGAARDNKGFPVLAEAIRLLHASGRLGGLSFTLQCNTSGPAGRTTEAVAMLKSLVLPCVRLVERPVTGEEYGRMLASAGAVVMPYMLAEYLANTSGIFTEALAAGKPVAVTAGTWMAAQLERFGAGVTFPDGDAAALADALARLKEDRAALAARAEAAAPAWTAYHNPSNFMKELVRAAGITADGE